MELLSHGLDMQDPVTVRTAAAALAAMTYDPATEVLRNVFESGQGIKAVYAAQQLYQMEPSDDDGAVAAEGARLAGQDDARRGGGGHCGRARRDGRDHDGRACWTSSSGRSSTTLTRRRTRAARAAAQAVLNEVRDALIAELEKTLDTKRAGVILEALGTIADKESVEKLRLDVNDTRLESSWRVAAANALGIAGLSSRVQPAIKITIIKELSAVLDDTGTDSRVRIGASISLCRLRQQNGVTFLLNELGGFEDAMSAGTMTEARRQDLTALRVRAQEALTQAGDYVVPFLMDKMKLEAKLRPMTPEEQQAALKPTGEAKPGNIIVWAAAKTMGELKVQDAIPYLGSYVTELKKNPDITIDAQGRMLADGKPADLALSNLEKPPEAEVTADQERLEIFAYPDYVRLTAAIALGNIGGEQSRQLLQKAEQAETGFLASLEASKKATDYYKRAPVIEGLIHKHQDVLFYLRLAQKPAGQKPEAPKPEAAAPKPAAAK